MNLVLDTNILVSAAWSPGRNASGILNAVFVRRFTVCYDYRMVPFERDEMDRKFFEVAKPCHAVLIIGNLAHYPSEPDILSPTKFCQRYL